MALFHKLFYTRKKCNEKYHNRDICEKLFTFSNEQVRIVLFRECDYRGRKLLFDSQTVEKVEISKRNEQSGGLKKELYAEVNNGHGFKLHKPSSDTKLLSEMIFGTVSMSHRGPSLKIHCLQSPPRIMYTQIFPSPKHITGNHKSTSNTYSSGVSTQSLDCSFPCGDYSSRTCSSNSMSDSSVHSTYSDTVLVCRRHSETYPLDVPKFSSCHGKTLNVGETADSGIDGFHDFHRSSATDISFGANELNFSCGSLYKKYLRSTSTSLEYSGHSLNTSASAEYYPKSRSQSNNKLGVAIIIELTKGDEQRMEKFLLEHAALMESMIWSARQTTEIAYIRYQNFFSIMNQLTMKIKRWLVKFLSGPHLPLNMWIGLSSAVCDNLYSIPSDYKKSNYSLCESQRAYVNGSVGKKCSCDNSDGSEKVEKPGRTFEFSVLNWTDFFKYDFNSNKTNSSDFFAKDNVLAKRFINEFCELLENVDVKDTKFFMSTLVTAILTHHLGWVSTVLPASSVENEKMKNLQCPSNALWSQLVDLYGAVGHPTKMSHTVISGTNKEILIEKILNCLSYFVRCSDLERKNVLRKDPVAENKVADIICQESSFIPKENSKKYKDHIKELEENSKEFFKKLDSVNASSKKNIYTNCKSNEKDEVSKATDQSETCSNKSKVSFSNSNNIQQNKGQISLVEKIQKLGIEALNTSSCPNKFNTTAENSCQMQLLSSGEATEGFKKIFTEKCRSPSLSNVSCDNSKGKCYEKTFKFDDSLQKKPSNTLNGNSPPKLTTVVNRNEQIKSCSALDRKGNNFSSQFSSSTLTKSNSLRRTKTKAVIDLSGFNSQDDAFKESSRSPEQEVVFVLGENEKLVGIKRELSNRNLNKMEDKNNNEKNGDPLPKRFLNHSMENDFLKNSLFKEKDFITNGPSNIKLSSSYVSVDRVFVEENKTPAKSTDNNKNRSQSVPPEEKKTNNIDDNNKPCKNRYRYSGVKFNFHQYPQIVENYLKSKNIEMSTLPFYKDVSTLLDDCKFDFSYNDSDDEEMETLQTPSNASDVVSFSELSNTPKQSSSKYMNNQKSKTSIESNSPKKTQNLDFLIKQNNIPENSSFKSIPKSNEFEILKRQKDDEKLEELNNVVMETHIPQKNVDSSRCLSTNSNALFEREETDSKLTKKKNCDHVSTTTRLNLIELPMPNSLVLPHFEKSISYTNSLMRGVGENYISNMVLQGTCAPKVEWESTLKQDLILCTRHPLLDQQIDEAVAIVANTDTWDVQLLSSHTYIVDKGSSGVRVGMSQLVSNMLESLLQLWKMQTSPENCLLYIEQKLQELCILSKALAQLLLATEFCSMELLTSTLHLEVNDVPLLMAVASTHSPQVSEKYGLSFQ